MTDLTKKIADATSLRESAQRLPWIAQKDADGSNWTIARFGASHDGGSYDLTTNRVRCSEYRGGAAEDCAFAAHAVNHHAALWDCAEVLSQLVAEALAVSRMQARGYGMQGKLAYLRKSAEDGAAALARLEQVQP